MKIISTNLFRYTISLMIVMICVFSLASNAQNTLLSGGDRLVATQAANGGWGWPLTGAGALNTVGPCAMGLAQSYLYTHDAGQLTALTNAKNLLLAKTNNFSPSDGYLAKMLDQVFGNTICTQHVLANYYTPLANGSYNRNGAGTLYSTQTYITLIHSNRSATPNMAAWDIGIGLVGAASCGITGTELGYWKSGVKDEINVLNGADYYDVIGLAGALYGLAYVHEEFDPTTGQHAAASNLNDLANILASYQINMGGFAWNSAFVIPNDANEGIQETSYSILALNEVNHMAYLANIQGAANYLASIQLPSHGWEGYVGYGENNEITGEALWGYSIGTATVHNVTQDKWYTTIQAAVDAASANDVISVYPANYSETATDKTPVSVAGTYTFGLYICPAKQGITIQGVDATGIPITNYASILANVETNASNNFGPDGIFMEGDNVTITGLKIWQNPALGTNKTITVIGDNFNLKYCKVTDISATDPWGSVYIDDELYNTGTNTSHIQSYNIEGNWLKDCSIDPNNGAGYSGPVSGRKIINNNIQLGTWAGASISFSGSGTGVPWFVHGVGGAIITGNTFSENTQHIRVRGDYDNAQFNWASYWNDNIFDKAVITGINPPTDVREYSYTGGYGLISHVRRIGAVIQSEIDNVAQVNDVIKVATGTYAENVIVNKSLTIKGPNALINPCSGARVAEATVVPGTAAIASGEIFHVAASNVTITGFTINGDNTAITSGFTSTNGADIDAAEGITVYETGVNNLTATNNIIKNLSYFGITLYDYPAGVPSSGHVISNNKIQDLGTYDAGSGIDYWGGGVLLYNNQYAAVTNNCMDNLRLGIQTGNFSAANPGTIASQSIDGNTMTNIRRVGVFHNLAYGTASAYSVSNNSITGVSNTNETKWDGIELFSLSVPSAATDNIINAASVTQPSHAYDVWNITSASPAAISGGTTTGATIGVFVNNFDGYGSNGGDGAHANISNITINPSASGTGIRVYDNPSSTHANVQAAIGAGVVINNGTDGLIVENTSASVTSLGNVAFTGQTGSYIKLINNTTNIDATTATFEGNTGAVATITQNFTIEDKITHKIDNGALGFVLVKANNDYVTVNSFISPVTTTAQIQRGIDAASNGFTVNVRSGNYAKQKAENRYVFGANGPHQFGLFIDKDNLTINGYDGSDAPVANASAAVVAFPTNSTANFGPSGVFVQGNGVTLEGLKIGDNYDNSNVISSNKSIEVVGDAFMMNKCWLNTSTDEGAFYMGRWDASHPIVSYSLTNNRFTNSVVSINNGAGITGPRSGRVITGNAFDGVATPYLIGFRGWNGSSPVQGWIVDPVGGAVITGNSFNNTGVDKYVVARGNAGGYVSSELLWNDIWNLNTYGNHVVTLSDYPTFTPRTYDDGAGYTQTRRISTLIQENESIGQTGDVVLVSAGTYPENVVVNNSVTIRGEGQANTFVIPAISSPNSCPGSICPTASNIFLIQANDVTIRGLTADGNNPSLISGILSDGVDVDARNGIITNHNLGVYNNLTVHDVTVKNIYLRGMYASTGGSFNFHDNTVTNVQGNANSIGMFNFGGSGSFTNNTVSDCNDAIASNHSSGTTYSGNIVSNSGSGIHTDNNGSSGGVADVISNNTVQNSPANGYGIFVFAPHKNVIVEGNTITNVEVGLTSAGSYTTATPVFRNNVVDGLMKANSIGVYSTTEIWGYPSGNQNAQFLNNYIKNNVKGFLLASEAGYTNSTTAHENSITGNTNGVKLVNDYTEIPPTGSFALSMTCNWWGTTVASSIAGQISGGPVTYIPFLTSGTDTDLGTIGFQTTEVCAACALGISTSSTPANCPLNNDGTATVSVTSGGSGTYTYLWTPGNQTTVTAIGLVAGSYSVTVTDINGCTASASATVSNSLAGPVHNSNTGLNYCTIQAAINAATAGNIITVAAGTYAEHVIVNKALDIRGPNYGISGTGSRVPEAIIVPETNLMPGDPWTEVVFINADNVSFDGFKISGDNPSINGYDYAGMNLEKGQGVYSEGNGVHFSNNIVEKATTMGFFAGGTQSTQYQNLVVDNNKINKIHDVAASGYGFGFYIQGTAGAITNNVVTNVRNGIQIQPYRVVKGITTPVLSVKDNDFAAYKAGIYYNYAEVGASAWTIESNNVTVSTPPVTPASPLVWTGIKAETMISTGNGGIITNNIVDGTGATIGSNWSAIRGMHYTGGASNSTQVFFTNNTVSNVLTGFMHDAVANIVFTGNSLTASQKAIDVTGAFNIDATGGNTINAVATTGATNAQLFAIEDAIDHRIDESFRGLVQVKANELFITTNSFAGANTSAAIQRGIDAASNGFIVNVDAGTFNEPGQISINKNITVLGAGNALTIMKPTVNTTQGGNLPSESFIYIYPSATVTLEKFRIDGIGRQIHHAIQSRGSLAVNYLDIRNIKYSQYNGRGIVFYSGTANSVTNTTFSNIERIGIHVRGAVITPTPVVSINGMTYTGKGTGDWLDYGVEIGGGGNATIHNSVITLNKGEASDGSTSAGILATSYFGPGTTGLITNNFINNNTTGIAVGYDETDVSAVTANNNDLSGNTSLAIQTTAPTVNATCNWYGSTDPALINPLMSGAVTYVPWLTSGVDASADIGFQTTEVCAACNITAVIYNNSETTELTCTTTAISLTATGGDSYSWSDGTNVVGTTDNLSVTTPGTYTVTVSTTNGCTATASIVITQNTTAPSAPTIGTITQPTCATATGSVVLSGLPETGTWTINPGPITGSGTSTTISLLATGTYNYTVTNSYGCTSVFSANVVINEQPSVPVVDPITGTSTMCKDGVTQLVDGTVGGIWSSSDAAIASVDVIGLVTGVAAGNTTIHYAVNNNCGTTTVNFTVTVTQSPAPTGLACYETATWNGVECAWIITGSQPVQPPVVNCWDNFIFNTTECAWVNTGSQPVQPPVVNCWDNFIFNTTTCAWVNTGSQPVQPPVVNCWDNFIFNTTTCAWVNTGTQPVQPPVVNCWDNFIFNTTTCAWVNTGTQPVQPPVVNCWDNFIFNTTTCAWVNTGSQPVQPPVVNCWDNFIFNTTTCAWVNTGSQPVQPPVVNCWDNFIFNTTECAWVNTGSQPVQPPVVNCWDNFIFNTTTCAWVNTGSQPVQPPVVNCWDNFVFNTTTCAWVNTGSQPVQPPVVNCWDNFIFNTTECAWVNTGSQPVQPPVVNCWDNFIFNTTTCAWVNTGSQPVQPPVVNCWDNFIFNTTECAWVNTGSQPVQPPVVNCWDNFIFNTTECAWVNTGTQPVQPPVVNCWDNFIFNTTTCAWVNTGSQPVQPPVVNCWDNFIFNTTECAWVNTGSQPVQPPVVNCWDNFIFNTTECAWVNTGSQPVQPPVVNCWDNFIFNTTTCAWVNTGSQPVQPPVVNCWDNFIFNTTTCAWVNTGTQPVQPPVVNCWDNFIFNTTECAWVNTGSQPVQPPVVNCWDNFIFNTTTCAWVNTGSQPVQPPVVNCWDNFIFNTTTCAWVNTGTQPVQPPVVNCWDNFIFNTTECAWVNTGSQPVQPPVVNCWDNFIFNTTTCAWVNTGSQPVQPPVVNCWDNFIFNTTTCAWVNTGTQPVQPPVVNCWDNFIFNTTECAWVNTGSQPVQPPVVNCWDNFIFNTTTCAWVNTGSQPVQPPVVNCWDNFIFNTTTCAWVNTGTQPVQPPVVNCWDNFIFNTTTCAWVNTGTQPVQPPVVNCWDNFIFNTTECAWVNTGSQPVQPPVVNCWDNFIFNTTTCAWVNTGTQPVQPPVVNCWDNFIFNTTECAWVNTGSQPVQPPVVNCWDNFIFNTTTCAWVNTGSQPVQPPVVNCWDNFIFNTTTCAWVNTGTQPVQPPVVNCWDNFIFNTTECAWVNTGSQPVQPPVVNCWDNFIFNTTTCAWVNTGSQPVQPPVVNCWDNFIFNTTTCAWVNTGSQPVQPPVVNCWDNFIFNTTTCAWVNTGSQPVQPPVVNCWDNFIFNTTTCAWVNTGSQPVQPPVVNCWDNFIFNTTTCAWVNTGSQPVQPPVVNCWDNFIFNTTECAWVNTGTQPVQPPVVNCWDNFIFNTTTCAWVNTGTQPVQPPVVNCWDNFIFNTTECAWVNTGTQPVQPPVVNCWDNFIFNTTTCAWVNTGTQPVQPPVVNCWDNFVFNTTTCAWVNTGSQPTAPTVGTITQPTCILPTGTVILNGLPSSGTWMINPGGVTGSGTSTTISGLAPGTYNFTVTNAAGCTSAASVNVVISAPPAGPPAPIVGKRTQPTCASATGSVVLSGLPSTGTWTINPGGITGTGTSKTISGLTAATYNFTVTNAAGCTSAASVNVVINSQPIQTAPIVGSITQPTCTTATGTVILNGLPASGTWILKRTPGGTTSGTGTSKTMTGLAIGTYTYTVTNAAGCISEASEDVVINPPTAPTAPIVGTITQPACTTTTGTVILNGLPSTGTWTLRRSPGGTTTTGTGTSKLISGLAAGTYTYTVTNAAGCTSAASAGITINTAPVTPAVTISVNSEIFCSNLNLTLTAVASPTGLYDYLWTPGGETTASKNLTAANPDGPYTVLVTNAAGCSGSATYNYVQQNSLNGYTILGLHDVNLGHYNTINGSVGNTAGGQKVAIDRYSTVSGFVKASVINLTAPVTVTGGTFNSPAVVTLPPMQFNTASVPSANLTVPDNATVTVNANYNYLTIGKGATVIINGTIYGKIVVKEGAQVTFTQELINIDYLSTENGKYNVNFTTMNYNGSSVRVKHTVFIGDRNRVNGTNTTFYMGDNNPDAEKFTVSGNNTNVTANVYMPHGKMDVDGTSGGCIMTGKYIAEYIESEDHVTWNGYDCNAATAPFVTIQKVVKENPVAVEQESFSVKVYPNPSNSDFTIQVTSNHNEPIVVRVLDISGKVLGLRYTVTKGSMIKLGSELRGGTYFAEVIQGTNKQIVKLVKLN